MSARFQSFGAECVTCNGHDIDSIIAACNTEHKGKPLVVICRTHGYTGVPPLKDKYPFLHFVRISEEEKPVYQAIYEEMMERSAAEEADAPAGPSRNASVAASSSEDAAPAQMPANHPACEMAEKNVQATDTTDAARNKSAIGGDQA